MSKIDEGATVPRAVVTPELLAEHTRELLDPEPQQVSLVRDPAADGFPLDALPDGCSRLAGHLHDRLSFPTDYIGSSMLCAASIAIGASVRLKVKEGWYENPLLWMVLVGKPGANKTHPMQFALAPLQALDEDHHRRYQAEMARYREQQSSETGEASTPRPQEVQHLVSDVTPEALFGALYRNPRGVGLHRDELAGWMEDFGRYSKGGDAEKYLSIWNSKPVRVDRKTDGSKLIARPFVTVCGTMQPAVLNRLTADGRSGNGFIDRFLFAYPEGADMRPWTEDQMDPTMEEWWRRFLGRLVSISMPLPEDVPLTLSFSDDARKVWGRHHETLRTRINELNAQGSEARAGHLTKMVPYTLRLALTLQIMEWAESGEQELPSMVEVHNLGAAILLVNYYISTAEKVLFSLHDCTPVDALPGNKRALYAALTDPFTTADAVREGATLKIPERTVKSWLNDRKLFDKKAHGRYSKRYEN